MIGILKSLHYLHVCPSLFSYICIFVFVYGFLHFCSAVGTYYITLKRGQEALKPVCGVNKRLRDIVAFYLLLNCYSPLKCYFGYFSNLAGKLCFSYISDNSKTLFFYDIFVAN